MAVNDRLRRYLDEERAPYETLPHREAFSARQVEEEGKGRLFPDCEIGAMPPFGQLYGMPVYVDACLAQAQAIVAAHEASPRRILHARARASASCPDTTPSPRLGRV
jgi:hypothetical protein